MFGPGSNIRRLKWNLVNKYLNTDPAEVTDELVDFLRTNVRKNMRRYGGVIGISGGVNSSVVLALCVRAFSPNKIAAIMLPEKDSDPESESLAAFISQPLWGRAHFRGDYYHFRWIWLLPQAG